MASAAGSVRGPGAGMFAGAAEVERVHGAAVPWYIWLGVMGVTSASIGGAWDVSWHRSVGRDTFWTAPHLMIQACGIMAGIAGLWLVWQATWGGGERGREMRANSVSVFGLRAPLGVFLAGWGGVAMLTSAPFDNWWHAAYGLDVKIISPPHALLVLGIRAVSFGVLFLILAAMNRAATAGTADHKKLRWLFLYMGGLMVAGQMFFLQEKTWDVVLHQMGGYIAMAIAIPVIFATFSAASQFKYSASVTAAVYMAFCIGEILILPLFPAQPKLGPVFYPVTHLVPAKFPVLLLVPALLLDLFWARAKTWKMWQIALLSGVLFAVVVWAVEWPFANFLMSKASQNRFFGSGYFDYTTRSTGYEMTRRFFKPEWGMQIVSGLVTAAMCGVLSTWAGMGLGKWMRGVQR